MDGKLPNNEEAERAVLGAILLDNSAYKQAAVLAPDDFFLPNHRRLFRRIGDVAENSRPIDLVTLADELMRDNDFEQVGGASYISSLTDGQPRLENIQHYVRIVKEKALLRLLILHCELIRGKCEGGAKEDLERALELVSELPSLLIQGGSEESEIRIVPSAEVPLPDPGTTHGTLWPFLPAAPALVLLAGETSAGKSVLAYNFSYSLAECRVMAGLTPQREFRVLHIDLESPEDVHRSLVETIGRSRNLGFLRCLPHTLDSVRGRSFLLHCIREWKADVVVLDPLSLAWPVQDENDNAEADRQMWGLKKIAVETNCLIIGLWNMGEGNQKDKFRARGATARQDRSDLGLNYTELTESTRLLKIVKSRYGTLGMSLALKFAEDMGFEAIETGDGATASKLAYIQSRIREVLASGNKTRRELVEALGNEDIVDKALHRLSQAGEVQRPQRGVYALPSSEPPYIREEDSEEIPATPESPIEVEI